jgi:hypothetical protein
VQDVSEAGLPLLLPRPTGTMDFGDVVACALLKRALRQGASQAWAHHTPVASMEITRMILAYFSPEVILPLATVLAGISGFIMMVGRAPFRWAARGARVAVKGWRHVTSRRKS